MSDASISTKQEDFASLLEESFTSNQAIEGSVFRGTVVKMDGDFALVDVGLKSEGRVPLREFGRGNEDSPMLGQEVDVFIEKYEDKDGVILLSRDKARREEAWDNLEKQFADEVKVKGIIFGKVKGGFTVDLNGAVAFLPGSQVDIRPVRDGSFLVRCGVIRVLVAGFYLTFADKLFYIITGQCFKLKKSLSQIM